MKLKRGTVGRLYYRIMFVDRTEFGSMKELGKCSLAETGYENINADRNNCTWSPAKALGGIVTSPCRVSD